MIEKENLDVLAEEKKKTGERIIGEEGDIEIIKIASKEEKTIVKEK